MTTSEGNQAHAGGAHPMPACSELRHQQQQDQGYTMLGVLLGADPLSGLGRQLLRLLNPVFSGGHAAALTTITKLRLDLAEQQGVSYSHQLEVLLGAKHARHLMMRTDQITGLLCAWVQRQQQQEAQQPQQQQQRQQHPAAQEELQQQKQSKGLQQVARMMVGHSHMAPAGATTTTSVATSSGGNDSTIVSTTTITIVTTTPRHTSGSTASDSGSGANNGGSSRSSSSGVATAAPPPPGASHPPGAQQKEPFFTQLTLLGPLSEPILQRLMQLLDVLPGTEHLGCIAVAADAGSAITLHPRLQPGFWRPDTASEVVQDVVCATIPRWFGQFSRLLPPYMMSDNRNSDGSSSSSSSRAASSPVPRGGTGGSSWRSSCRTVLVGDMGPTSLSAVAPLLRSLPQLQGLYVPGAVAEHLPTFTSILEPLRALHVAGGTLNECSPVLPTLTNLRHLSLEGCERHHIPCALPHDCCKLVQLTSLAFRYTPVTNEGLAVLCGAASSLKRLELNGLSHITGLPAVISRLTGLNTIELWGTRIATLPPDITALTGLRKLAWAGAGTPAALQPVWDLPALDYLAIGMHFTSFPADVSKLKQLRQLHIWGDRLEELSDSMTTLVGLERFSLRSERLQVLPAFITQLSGLTCIALHCRQLQALPPDVQAFVDARKPAE